MEKKQVITNIITKSSDLNPKFKKNEYLAYKFFSDKDLGSINRNNTKIQQFITREIKIISHYTIGKNGERENNLKYKSSLFSSYGDSLCFCDMLTMIIHGNIFYQKNKIQSK